MGFLLNSFSSAKMKIWQVEKGAMYESNIFDKQYNIALKKKCNGSHNENQTTLELKTE